MEHIHPPIRSICKQASRAVTYGRNLRNKDEAYMEVKAGVSALLGCNENGKLTKKYFIVELKYCERRNEIHYFCSCKEENCLHISQSSLLSGPQDDYMGDETDDFEYAKLTETLSGIYSKKDKSYSILHLTPNLKKCLTCNKNVTNCTHIHAYLDYKLKTYTVDPPPNAAEEDKFKSISTESVPYLLLEQDDINLFSGYVSGQKPYPDTLFPPFDASKKCKHGNIFSKDLKEFKGGQLHLQYITLNVTVCYRTAIGCECRQHYDGRSDLLLNLDNIHIFPHIWLWDILHNTQENKYTLHGAFRSANHTRQAGYQMGLPKNMYDKLRFAYNCFLRLLDLNYKDIYSCPRCTNEPDTVIMDGVSIGGRKDRLPHIDKMPLPTRKINGSTIKQRLFVREESTRKILPRYATLSKGGDILNKYKPLLNQIMRSFVIHCQVILPFKWLSLEQVIHVHHHCEHWQESYHVQLLHVAYFRSLVKPMS